MHWSRGMQEGEQEKYLKVVSTAKHFADYDQEGNGGVDRGTFNAVVNDQDQVEYYFPHGAPLREPTYKVSCVVTRRK